MTSESPLEQSVLERWGPVVIAWTLVSLPLFWGVLMTAKKAFLLFNSTP